MTDSKSNSASTWGALTPVMPAVIRLMAGLIVLVIVEAVVLGFPGISQDVSGTTISVASLVALFIGLIVVFIVLKYGTQIASTIHEHYDNYRTWTPLLSYFFQLLAIVILYYITAGVALSYFSAAPWAFPLMFLLIALVPTIKVVTNLVHDLDSQTAGKHPN
jgi:hypothetical protein